jgi:hypothetical protein
MHMPLLAVMLLVFEHCGAPQPCPTAKEEEIRMSPRSLSVTFAAILLALFSVMNFPGPWWVLVPGAAEVTPMFVIYSGIVLGIVGIVAAVGLWMMKTWSFWLTIVVCVVNILLNVSGLVMVLPGGLKALIAVQTIGFVLVIVLVVLPSSRRALAAAEQPSRVR